MVEATIRTLNKIDKNTKKREVRDSNFEVIKAVKLEANKEVKAIVSDLEQAKKALSSMEDSEAAEKISKKIDEAIARVFSKENSFQEDLSKLDKENKKNSIKEETLDKVKERGNELNEKYQAAKALHNDYSAKESLEITPKTTPEVIPQDTSDVIPDTTPQVTPQATPQATSQATSQTISEEGDLSSQTANLKESEPVVIGEVEDKDKVEDRVKEEVKNEAVIEPTKEKLDKQLAGIRREVTRNKKSLFEKLEKLTKKEISLKGSNKTNGDIRNEIVAKYNEANSQELLEALKNETDNLVNCANQKIIVDNKVLIVIDRVENGKYKTDKQAQDILAEARRLRKESSEMVDARQLMEARKTMNGLISKLALRIAEIEPVDAKDSDTDEELSTGAIRIGDETPEVLASKSANEERKEDREKLDADNSSEETKQKSETSKKSPEKTNFYKGIQGSIESLSANYGGEKPNFLKKYIEKSSFRQEDLANLETSRRSLERRISVVNGDLSDYSQDKGLRDIMKRFKAMEAEGYTEDDEIYRDYRDKVLQFFNNGMEKLLELKANVKKSLDLEARDLNKISKTELEDVESPKGVAKERVTGDDADDVEVTINEEVVSNNKESKTSDEELISKIKATPAGKIPASAAIDLDEELSPDDLRKMTRKSIGELPESKSFSTSNSEEAGVLDELISSSDIEASSVDGDVGVERKVKITDDGQEINGEAIANLETVDIKGVGEKEIEESSEKDIKIKMSLGPVKTAKVVKEVVGEESTSDLTEAEKVIMDKSMDDKRGERFSVEDIENKIADASSVNELKLVIFDIIDKNGKIDMAKGFEWSDKDKASKNIDEIFEGTKNGEYFKRRMKGSLVIEKLQELLGASAKESVVVDEAVNEDGVNISEVVEQGEEVGEAGTAETFEMEKDDETLKLEIEGLIAKINKLSSGMTDVEAKKETAKRLEDTEEITSLGGKVAILEEILEFVEGYHSDSKNLVDEKNLEGEDGAAVETEVDNNKKTESSVAGLFVKDMSDEEFERQADDLSLKLSTLREVVDKDDFELDSINHSDFIKYRDAKDLNKLNALLNKVDERLDLAIAKKIVNVVAEIDDTMVAGVKDQEFEAKIKLEKKRIYDKVGDFKDSQKALREYEKLLGKIKLYIANQANPTEEKRNLNVEESKDFLTAAQETLDKANEAIKEIEDEEFKKQIKLDKAEMYAELRDSNDFELILEKYQDFLGRIKAHLREEARQRNLEGMKDLINDNTKSSEVENSEQSIAEAPVEGFKGLEGKEITLPEFKAGEVKVAESLEKTIEEVLLENGISADKVKEVVANVEIVLSSAIDAEAERDFRKITKHHKLKIATGLGVGLAATAATTAIRALGGSSVKLVFGAVSGTVLGATSGALRSKFREYLNPKIAKLRKRKSDEVKLEKVREEKSSDVLSDETVRLAIETVIKTELNQGKVEQGAYEEILANLNANPEYQDLSETQKSEIARSMLCLNKLAETNNQKLVGFLDKKKKGLGAKWKDMSATAKGSILGGVFGATTSIANAVVESGFAGGAASGLISGAMMGGSISDWLEKNKVDKKSQEMMTKIDKFDKGEEEVRVGTLRTYLESGALNKYPLARERAKVLLMTKLFGGNVASEIDESFKDSEEIERITKEFSLGGDKKAMAYIAGVVGGVLMGGSASAATLYFRESYDGGGVGEVINDAKRGSGEVVEQVKDGASKVAASVKQAGTNVVNQIKTEVNNTPDVLKTVAFEHNVLDYSSQDVLEKFGLNETALEGFDKDNNGEYNIEEVAKAQSAALQFDEQNSLDKPIPKDQFESLLKLKNDGISVESIQKVLADDYLTKEELIGLTNERDAIMAKHKAPEVALEEQPLKDKEAKQQQPAPETDSKSEDLAVQMNGLDSEQVAVIKSYQEILSDDKFKGIIEGGLSDEELAGLNTDIVRKYSSEHGIQLAVKDVGAIMRGETTDAKYGDTSGMMKAHLGAVVAGKQAEILGVSNMIKPLTSEQFNTLQEYSTNEDINSEKIVKEAIAQKVYDRAGIEKLVFKDQTGINLNTAKNRVMIREFDKIVSGDMSRINYAKIGYGDSISKVLNQAMSSDSKVVLINADGQRFDNFDANLVYEDDVVMEKNGEIYVLRTSGIDNSANDSLQNIYDSVDEKLEAEGVPEKFKEKYGESNGRGEFSSQVNNAEARELLKDWRSFTPEQQTQLRSGQLSSEHVDAILEKGKWVESWTTVGNGETVEASYVSIASSENSSPTSFELKVSDSKLNDGIPDEVEVNSRQTGYRRTFERGDMKADDFSEVVTRELNRVGDARADELSLVLANNKNLSIDEIEASGIKMYNGDHLDKTFETKLEFWNNNIGPLDTPAKAREFFKLLAGMDIDATEENMKFVIDGSVVGQVDRAEAVSFVEASGIDISYSDAVNYKDQIGSFDNIEQAEAVVGMIKGEDPAANMKKIFEVGSNAKYSYDKSTGIYKLYDIKLGKNGEEVNILLSKDAQGNLKFGYDGDAWFDEGTKGKWNSMRPDTELTSDNIDKLRDNLNKKFTTARSNKIARDR